MEFSFFVGWALPTVSLRVRISNVKLPIFSFILQLIPTPNTKKIERIKGVSP
jgi:hypothetical protein